ncbi:MAG: hypothetical protein PHT33_06970 [bacterium]|nr:hypothetical protein [bacterium]
MKRYCLFVLATVIALFYLGAKATSVQAGTYSGLLYPINQIVPDTMPDYLELDIVPKPKTVTVMDDEVLKLGRVLLVAPHLGELRNGREHLLAALGKWSTVAVQSSGTIDVTNYDTLVLEGSDAIQLAINSGLSVPANLYNLSYGQSYKLHVEWIPALYPCNIIIFNGVDRQAEFWAVQSLRQLTYIDGSGDAYVRQCFIEDWPTFSSRGFKRLQGFEGLYKANTVNASIMKKEIQLQNFADLYEYEYHPIKSPNYTLDVNATITAMTALIPAVGGEKRLLSLKFDDVEGDKPVVGGGDYYEAIRDVIDGVAANIQQTNPATRFHFMPQFYFARNFEYDSGGTRMRALGTLPAGVGTYTNGPEVNSVITPSVVVNNFRNNILADNQVKAMLYCPIYDIDDYFYGVPARPAGLSDVVDGISMESGNPLAKVTFCDWLWNPEAYSSDYSEKLACREIMGLNHWDDLYDLTSAIKSIVFHPLPYESRQDVIDRTTQQIDSLGSLLSPVTALSEIDLTGRLQAKEATEKVSLAANFGQDSLDETAYFNRALAQSEITALYQNTLQQVINAGTIPVNDFVYALNYEETQGRTATDISGHTGATLLEGDVLKVQGTQNTNGIYFNGCSGNLAIVPYTSGLNSQAFSFSTWFKSDDIWSAHILMDRFTDATRATLFRSIVIDRNYVNTPAYNGRVYVTGVGYMTPSKILNDGLWHHIVVTYDGLSTVRCYADGALQCTKTKTWAAVTYTGPAVIGGRIGATTASLYDSNVLRDWDHMKQTLTSCVSWYQNTVRPALQYYLKEATALRTYDVMTIDGLMNEPSWQQAGTGTGFLENGDDLAPPDRNMTFRVMYDDQYLYFGANGRLNVSGGIDTVQFMLDAAHNHNQTYVFKAFYDPNAPQGPADPKYDFFYNQLSAAGTQDIGYDSGWEYRYSISGNEWKLEARIPISALGGVDFTSESISGLQVMYSIRVWTYRTTWRGNVDPEIYGHLLFN